MSDFYFGQGHLTHGQKGTKREREREREMTIKPVNSLSPQAELQLPLLLFLATLVNPYRKEAPGRGGEAHLVLLFSKA